MIFGVAGGCLFLAIAGGQGIRNNQAGVYE
jgi:hypothetical protein